MSLALARHMEQGNICMELDNGNLALLLSGALERKKGHEWCGSCSRAGELKTAGGAEVSARSLRALTQPYC